MYKLAYLLLLSFLARPLWSKSLGDQYQGYFAIDGTSSSINYVYKYGKDFYKQPNNIIYYNLGYHANDILDIELGFFHNIHRTNYKLLEKDHLIDYNKPNHSFYYRNRTTYEGVCLNFILIYSLSPIYYIDGFAILGGSRSRLKLQSNLVLYNEQEPSAQQQHDYMATLETAKITVNLGLGLRMRIWDYLAIRTSATFVKSRVLKPTGWLQNTSVTSKLTNGINFSLGFIITT